jgi:hypothetical protein
VNDTMTQDEWAEALDAVTGVDMLGEAEDYDPTEEPDDDDE